MSQVIEIKRAPKITLKFDGEEHVITVPSLETLLPFMEMDHENVKAGDSIKAQRKVLLDSGLPDIIIKQFTPDEHKQVLEIIMGQYEKKK